MKMAKIFGIPKEKLKYGLLVPEIGNTYSGASMIGLVGVLENAKPEEKVLVTSFGSGAGSDAFSFVVTDEIEEIQSYPYSTDYYLNRKEMIDYGVNEELVLAL